MKNGNFYGRLAYICIPIMVQNLISSALSFVDTLMIGQIGQNEIAAVGIANQVFFLISLFFFGIASGTGIFLSQFHGSGEKEKMKSTMAFACTICVMGALLISIYSFFFPESILGIFTSDSLVTTPGKDYLKWVAISYIFSAVSTTLSIGFRAINKAHWPMVVTMISLTTNAIGNYLLIFGIGPFPEMGVSGAALATTLSRMLEMLMLLYLTWTKKQDFAFRRKDFSWDRGFIGSFTTTSIPVVFNEVFWALGMILYKVAYSKLGTEALATINITESIANFFFIAMMGIGNGTTILLGNMLGAGRKEEARKNARLILRLAIVIGVLMFVFEYLSAPLFASWFNVSKQVALTAIACLRLNAVLQPIKSLNMVIIVGILRSGGDTKAAMAIEMIGLYLVGVPLSFFFVLALSWPLYLVYIATGFEELVKLLLGFTRYKKYKWAKVLTNKA